jgi:hypothetical protein
MSRIFSKTLIPDFLDFPLFQIVFFFNLKKWEFIWILSGIYQQKKYKGKIPENFPDKILLFLGKI